MAAMQHNLSHPCAQCPFRHDIPGFLTEARVLEITDSLYRGESFTCHKTLKGRPPEQCAGAEIFLVKQGYSTQLGRIAERLGMAAKLNLAAPVCDSLEELLEHHAESET